MHELAVTQSVLEIVLRHARLAGGARVSAIHLVIGQISSIVDDSVAFYWQSVARGTPAEGARLCFRRVPARFRCEACGREFPLQEDARDCPGCTSSSVWLIAGDEFSVESIEVEESSTRPSGPAGG